MTEASAKKASRSTLVDQAYAEIKRRIMGNFYPPTLRVLEQELALQLGMSRTPVREAMIRLEREGLIEILPRKGMRVLPVSPSDMRDIYEVLTVLEAQASQRLARRRPTREEIKPLIEAVEEMEAALKEKDLERWAVGDGRFHRSLLELCGNRRMASMATQVFDQVHRARMVTLRMRPLPTKSNKDHRELVEAILAGDGDRAYDIHHRHRDQAMMMLVGILERYKIEAL